MNDKPRAPVPGDQGLHKETVRDIWQYDAVWSPDPYFIQNHQRNVREKQARHPHHIGQAKRHVPGLSIKGERIFCKQCMNAASLPVSSLSNVKSPTRNEVLDGQLLRQKPFTFNAI